MVTLCDTLKTQDHPCFFFLVETVFQEVAVVDMIQIESIS